MSQGQMSSIPPPGAGQTSIFISSINVAAGWGGEALRRLSLVATKAIRRRNELPCDDTGNRVMSPNASTAERNRIAGGNRPVPLPAGRPTTQPIVACPSVRPSVRLYTVHEFYSRLPDRRPQTHQ